MTVFPAIDIKGGKCVRLVKGDFSTAAKVADDYMDTARGFEAAGAKWIHMIDLDGAKSAAPKNSEIFIAVAKNTTLNVQVGGGIRTLETAEFYLNNGVSRVIFGSAAVRSPELIGSALRRFGEERVAVGIDAKNGLVSTDGWLKTGNVSYLKLADEMCRIGVKYFIFTDIDKDGTLSRPNHGKTKLLQSQAAKYGANVIASGGIKTISNIKTLKKNGIYGVICGKSLYSGTLDLKEAIITAGKD